MSVLLGLLVAWAVVACGTTEPATDRPVAPTPIVAQPVDPGTIGPLSAAALEEARQVRVRYGLRADETWIRAVAVDPTAQQGVDEFGVPLMPFELQDLGQRHTDSDILQQINDYGSSFPESYAGAYMDQRASQAFVAAFKDDADGHRAALAKLLPPDARVDVRDVEWSTRELDDFVKVVDADQAWFETIGVRYLTADRGIIDDFVSVDYLGPAEAAQLIEDHFGAPTWLVADRQGPLPWEGPRGNLSLLIVDEAGNPVPGLHVEVVPDDPNAAQGGEDVFGTDDAGRCLLKDLPAVPYHVTLLEFVNDDHDVPIDHSASCSPPVAAASPS